MTTCNSFYNALKKLCANVPPKSSNILEHTVITRVSSTKEKKSYVRTTVLPLCMLCVSLWAWAQKSMQAVTPEKGLPSLDPSRQSGPMCSFST